MRQRVLIAMALAAGPRLLVADEPTSALDTALRAQIMALLGDLSRELGMSLLVITHDLSFVADIADELVVLYAGTVVETGRPSRVLTDPRHPYTRALVQSVPPTGHFRARGERRVPLPTIEGALPDLRTQRVGCPFAPRCAKVMDRCRVDTPPNVAFDDGAVRCFLYETPGKQGNAA
jgi:oligopeptide/dipeptide ABC transporter ATP-binding protein